MIRERAVAFVVVVIAAFSSQWAAAQAAPPGGQRIVQESWTFKDGAPEVSTAFAQTADGYLWVGSPAGLFRFDGVRFELFRSPFGDSLHSTNVSTLLAAGDGLWVGYVFGGFSFLKNGRVRNFVEATASVAGFADDKHGITWAGTATRSGLWRYDGSSWQRVGKEWNVPNEPVAQIGFDRDGILWVLTGLQGPEGPKQLYFLAPGGRQFRKAAENLFVLGFTRDADGNVLTTRERNRDQPVSSVERESSLPAYPILREQSEQILDQANAVWVIPSDPVVFRHPASEPLDEVISKISPANSEVIPVNPMNHAFLVDREGTIWFGTASAVHRFSYSPLMRQQVPPGSSPWFMLAPDDGGAVWISAGDGVGRSTLYRVSEGRVDLQRSIAGVSSFAYRAPDKSFWFGGEGGLWRMVDGRLAKVDLPKELAERARTLVTMTHDGSGGFWVSFAGLGLYRLKDGNWTKYQRRPGTPPPGTGRGCPATAVMAMFTDRASRVWLGCTKGQLAVLDANQEQAFGPSDGLQVGNVTAIYGRGSEIWIGGEFGLQRFDQGRFHTIRAIGSESLRGISGIVETANGDLWLNGLGGIVHIRREEILASLKDPAYQVSVERFDRRAGLPGLPSQLRHMPTAIEGTDGRLWFTVSNGVVWLDPTRASSRIPPPPVSIQSVTADDQVHERDQLPRFPAGTSNVQISYAAISLLNPEAIRFRYRLRGMEDEWHEGARSTSVSYRNLTPGSYHFQVDASDTNGVWSGKLATAEFTILPAYYQTLWFRALCAMLILFLAWVGYQFYRARARDISERRLAEEAVRGKDQALEMARAELARVSRVTTLGALTTSIAHEVNQPLGAMVANAAACARWLAAQPPEVGKARQVLESITADGKRAGEIIGRIRALTKRQPPPGARLDVDREILDVLALVDDLLRTREVAVETRFESDLPPVWGDRVQLQQVLLNLIVNAIDAMGAVHDRPRALTIVSKRDGPDAVAVEVRDSGTGLDPEAAERVFEAFYTTKPDGIGIGLSISRSIIEAHGGQMSVSANAPHGAVFRFTLPLAEEELS